MIYMIFFVRFFHKLTRCFRTTSKRPKFRPKTKKNLHEFERPTTHKNFFDSGNNLSLFFLSFETHLKKKCVMYYNYAFRKNSNTISFSLVLLKLVLLISPASIHFICKISRLFVELGFCPRYFLD